MIVFTEQRRQQQQRWNLKKEIGKEVIGLPHSKCYQGLRDRFEVVLEQLEENHQPNPNPDLLAQSEQLVQERHQWSPRATRPLKKLEEEQFRRLT
jgi:hypothetical protein